jgi:hypothetical protein
MLSDDPGESDAHDGDAAKRRGRGEHLGSVYGLMINKLNGLVAYQPARWNAHQSFPE